MKALLIFPPQWNPVMPSLSLPSLTAYLKNKGCNVSQRDLNTESYDMLLSRTYLSKIQEYVLARWKHLDSKDELSSQNYDEYCSGFQTSLSAPYIIDRIDKAKAVLRNSETFYNLELYLESMRTIDMGLKMISAAYYPTEITLSSFNIKNPLQSEADLFEATQDEQNNPFIYLYKTYFLEDIYKGSPELIGISIIGASQLVPGLTLARLIKLHYPDVYVVIGGSIFTRLVDKINNWTNIFGKIFDGIIVYEGEKPLLELYRCLSEGCDLASVPSLIHKNGKIVVVNNPCKPEKINLLPTPCFDGLPFDKYLSPHPILPILSSRGCYWGRCAFCDHGMIYGSRYSQRRIDLLMEDLRSLSEKYSTKFFTFNDEAIAPNRLRDLSNAITSKDLAIRSYAYIRLEPQFISNIFHLAFKAGFLALYSGLESGHNRVLTQMRKGVNCETAKAVLQSSSDAGIWNHVFLFFGFPTETEAEARETMDFIFLNKNIIHSVGSAAFSLNRCSLMMKDLDQFGVDSIHEDERAALGLFYSYTVSKGLTQEQAHCLADTFPDRIEKEYKDCGPCRRLWREHLLLYLDHYGGRDKLPLFRNKAKTSADQTGIDETCSQQSENLVLCGVAKFDIGKILSKKLRDEEILHSDNFIVIWDIEASEIISVKKSELIDKGIIKK